MYNIAVPCMPLEPTYDREKVLRDLRLMGAKRAFLALPFLSHDRVAMEKMYTDLQPEIAFLQKEGFEVGVWFWTFRLADKEAKYTVMVTAEGKACHTSTAKYCPWDAGFISFMQEHLRRLAAMHPDLIMFDDDLAFGFASMDAPSCFCQLHREKMGQYLGEPTPPVEGLYEKLFSGKNNKYRSAFLRSHGESLRNFARQMREAVDSVDPSVRLGQCGCITTFDYDGVDSFTLSKILAGNTRPFLRLIGAPYWDPIRLHGNSLMDVIELERMARAWYPDSDIEIFSEGDTYPRPRHRVPAAYLEIFDAALRAGGNMEGILKYALCYGNSPDYEKGYVKAHRKDEKDLLTIGEVFTGLSSAGVRVYETMQKIEDADFSHDKLTMDLARYQFFSAASRFLGHSSIPTTYQGKGCAGIAFGENARALGAAALEKPLILDEHAARILWEKGIDVGVESFGQRFIPTGERFLQTGELESVIDYRLKPAFASEMVLKPEAKVQSLWNRPDGTDWPGSFTYENAQGNRFLVLAMDGFTSIDSIYKNYSRQKQFMDFLADALPVRCQGNPELYVICAEDEEQLAVALFNCFADPIEELVCRIPGVFSGGEFFRCGGKLTEEGVEINYLAPWDWCFIKLDKQRKL